MSLKDFFNHFGGESLAVPDPTSIDRVSYSQRPFGHFINHYSKNFHVPHVHYEESYEPHNNFGVKYSGDTSYGPPSGGGWSGGGGGYDYNHGPAQPVYHSVHQPTHGKKNKLKGAALSAITLLAFLFFLNILQNCLKDQMQSMNPTIMVMTPTNVIPRNDLIYQKYKDDESVEYTEDYQYTDDYKVSIAGEKTNVNSKISRRTNKSNKQKSTIAPKLQNLLLRNSPQP